MLKISFIKLNTYTEHMEYTQKLKRTPLFMNPFWYIVDYHSFDNKKETSFSLFQDLHTRYAYKNASLIFICILCIGYTSKKNFTCFWVWIKFSPFGSTVHVNCSFDRAHHFYSIHFVVTTFCSLRCLYLFSCCCCCLFPTGIRFTMWFCLFVFFCQRQHVTWICHLSHIPDPLSQS